MSTTAELSGCSVQCTILALSNTSTTIGGSLKLFVHKATSYRERGWTSNPLMGATSSPSSLAAASLLQLKNTQTQEEMVNLELLVVIVILIMVVEKVDWLN